MHRQLFLLCGVIMFLGTQSVAGAYTVVVPLTDTAAEGNSNITTGAIRIQQVFSSSEFPPFFGPLEIVQIAFRPDGIVGVPFQTTNPYLQFNLSTTTRSPDATAPDGLSLTFDENTGTDDTIVRAGPATYGTVDSGPVGGPKRFDIVFPFSTPFIYDPARGNLLLDIRSIGTFAPANFDVESTHSDSVSTINASVSSPTGFFDTFGFVTQFTFTTVPEPAPFVLLVTGLAVMAGLLRRKTETGPKRDR
jgi:hypothetical protein